MEAKELIFKGELIAGDFEENTMTFEIDGEMILKAGDYMIISAKTYEDSVKGRVKKLEKALQDIRDWDEELEDQWGDQGSRAIKALGKDKT